MVEAHNDFESLDLAKRIIEILAQPSENSISQKIAEDVLYPLLREENFHGGLSADQWFKEVNKNQDGKMTVSELAEYINKNGVKEGIIDKLKGKAKENKIQDDAHKN
jgi:hypothetical protein